MNKLDQRGGKSILSKVVLYLDNCCFNRPYDDQTSLINYLETESKLYVQQRIIENIFDLAWSYVLDYENGQNPHDERRQAIIRWRRVAKIIIAPSQQIMNFAEGIANIGIKSKDALHISCAIEAKCDYFLTTDKRLLNKDVGGIEILNPIDFVRIMGGEQ